MDPNQGKEKTRECVTIGLIGNPNCGKTTLFNVLTGERQRVGNWPGVTIERKVGTYRFHDQEYRVVDLPGTYSLDVTDESASLDERIARDFVHTREADLLVTILDASNLGRNLYLTSQLIEMRHPLLVVLNMMDTAAAAGLEIDPGQLSRRLGCPVVPLVASRRLGVDELRATITDSAAHPAPPTAMIPYAPELEAAIAELRPLLEDIPESVADPRWLAVRVLEGDGLALRVAGDRVRPESLETLRRALPQEIDVLLTDGRYGFAQTTAEASIARHAQLSRSGSDRIDRIVLHRILGIPVFLLLMYLLFMFAIHIGSAFIDFFAILSGTLAVDGFAELLASMGSPDWLILLLAHGAGGGIQVVASFIPVIAFLYLFLSMLEDSGYMARAAFVTDRSLRAAGLPGKSFVPLVVGFGCNVPAIMAARTLDNPRDRLLTIAMIPFMSCGARLPVYTLFAAAFFPVGGQNIVFALYLTGIAVALLTGLVLKKTLLRGEPTPFLMELPPYRLPTLRGVLAHTWQRTLSFILGAGKIIVPMVLVIQVLNAVDTDGSFGRENPDQSILSVVGTTLAPAFAPLGIDEENWPAVVGILTGVLAKEALVGTLDSLYRQMAETGDTGHSDDATPEFSLAAGLTAAVASVPANLKLAAESWIDPLGLDVGELRDTDAAAGHLGVSSGTFGAMAAHFDGAAGAFAYLLFILLYIPCAASLAVIQRETSTGWMLFVAGWTTAIAYGTATVFYQAATLARDPWSASAWILAVLAALLALVLGMRRWGARAPGLRSTERTHGKSLAASLRCTTCPRSCSVKDPTGTGTPNRARKLPPE